jgi:membrane associated rhomboid family serine protease
MLYVSFAEILIKAQDTLTATLGEKPGAWATVGGFFGGILLIALIDNLIPKRKTRTRCTPWRRWTAKARSTNPS